MADQITIVSIPDLPVAIGIDGSEEAWINQNGADRRAALGLIAGLNPGPQGPPGPPGMVTVTVESTTTGTTLTPAVTSGFDLQYEVTALATAATIEIPTGLKSDGQKLMLRFKDNGAGRALTWTTSAGGYRAVGVLLPTTTVAGKVLYVGCIYNSQDNFWDVVATVQQA